MTIYTSTPITTPYIMGHTLCTMSFTSHRPLLQSELPLSSRPVFGRRRGRGGRGVRRAAASPLPAMALSPLSSGGTRPASRRQCQALVVPPRPPAKDFGAHVAIQRRAPVFPPTNLAGILSLCHHQASSGITWRAWRFDLPLCFSVTLPHCSNIFPLRLHITGRRVCHPVTVSYASAARSTSASAQCLPTSCRPTGNPAGVNPQGIEIAGNPAILNGAVKEER